MKELTIVVGAGASSEYRLPVGTKLKQDILEILRPRSPGGNVQDQDLYYAMMSSANPDSLGSVNFQNYIDAANHIRTSLPLSPSIDNFINSHRGNLFVEQVSKLAIAKSILQAERNSSLWFPKFVRDMDGVTRIGQLNFAEVEQTWLPAFFKLVTQDCPFDQLKEKLSKISFVVFNYDRCVEHFLFEAIKTFYAVDREKTQDVLSSLDIYHPYGLIGKLPWESEGGIDFGADQKSDVLVPAAGNIKTFSESFDPGEEEGLAIKKAVSKTNRLVFLGFGFIPLNMRLLASDEHASQSTQKQIFATAFGISKYDAQRISDELRNICGPTHDPSLSDCSAVKLFSDYTRGIAI